MLVACGQLDLGRNADEPQAKPNSGIRQLDFGHVLVVDTGSWSQHTMVLVMKKSSTERAEGDQLCS
jgi:hypothetical protein